MREGAPRAIQDELAGAGGIDPPNGGIKISLIIQRFQEAFGKNGQMLSNPFNSLAAVCK
jgi:hypothetical protein